MPYYVFVNCVHIIFNTKLNWIDDLIISSSSSKKLLLSFKIYWQFSAFIHSVFLHYCQSTVMPFRNTTLQYCWPCHNNFGMAAAVHYCDIMMVALSVKREYTPKCNGFSSLVALIWRNCTMHNSHNVLQLMLCTAHFANSSLTRSLGNLES